MFFDYIKQYYAMGLYTQDNLKTLQLGGMMTAEQYDELVGVADDAKNETEAE